MLIKNPNYAEPDDPKKTAAATRLAAWFAANTDKRGVTFEQVRAAAGKTPEEWPDGLIHQAALEAGYEVESN